MKIYRFLIILTINIVRGTKRKLDHVYMNNFDYFEVTKVFNSSNNQLYCKTCDNKISPTTAEFDIHYTKLSKYNGSDENFDEYYDYLEKVKLYRPVSGNNYTKTIAENPDSSRLKILENHERIKTSDQKEIIMSKQAESIVKNRSETFSATNKTEIECKKTNKLPEKGN
jgi:hypothetical protein